MKPLILFIAHRIPYPPNKGDKIRSFNELLYFSKKYDVDCIAFYDDIKDAVYEENLRKICRKVYLFYRPPKLSLVRGVFGFFSGGTISVGCYNDKRAAQLICRLIDEEKYLFVFCFSSQIAQFVMEKNVVKVIDFVDVDSDKWKQYANQKCVPFKWVYAIEAKRLGWYEQQVGRKFSLSVFTTRSEMNLFEQGGSPDTNINMAVFSNGVDYDFFSPIDIPREKALVFTGAMDYYPNIDAVTWFCREVFPQVLSQHPDVKFYIVGNNPSASVRKLASCNIIVTGFVKDIRSYIARSALAVFPLRIARGIQNKILEAMAMGITPLVPITLAGSLDGGWPEETIFYKNKKDCSTKIIQMLASFKCLDRPSEKLRAYIIKNRDWEEKMDVFMQQIECITYTEK